MDEQGPKDDKAAHSEGEAQAQKLMALGELSAGIVHEVRNMLTSIRGFAQIAQQRMDKPDELASLLTMIEHETARCVHTTSRFLGFSRRNSTTKQPVQVQSLIDEAVSLVRHQLEVHAVRIVIEVEEGLPPAQANRSALVQVLVNLAINAQQAMLDGGQVTIRAGREGDSVRFSVADDGPGVPLALQEHIFEPFFTTKEQSGGTGLGLSVSAQVAKEQGGSLTLEPLAAGGACFVMRLPLSPTSDEPGGDRG